MKMLQSILLGASMLSALVSMPLAAAEQYVPILSYRVGPYAAGGSGFFGGAIDY